ncbi:tyrosine-type recombinase/integrase [Halopenitus malekzadehii]|nr:tyrosine-type recombinase/integrase [Halopenitus malekzadehii]
MDSRRRRIAQGIQIGEHTSIKQSAAEALSGRSGRSHSRDDAITPRQWERMLRASYDIDNDEIALECRMLAVACGRLGLRAGEVTHLHEEWIDWNDGTIQIPSYWNCTKGSGDEVCGYCRNRARDNLDSHNLTEEEATDAIVAHYDDATLESMTDDELLAEAQELREEVNVTLEAMLEKRWSPKTSTSARGIPFDFSARIELIVEQFFDRFDAYEKSFATVHRRIDRLADCAGIESNVYPHALRATSASFHASRDISVHALMSIMGWADPGTARVYIQSNDEKAAHEIRSKHR